MDGFVADGFAAARRSKDIRDYSEMRCPLHGLMTLLSGTWTTYILWLVRVNGPMRFGQLRKQMPAISAKVLTERLRMLEEAQIVSRHHEPGTPPKVTYSFTERGRDLNALLDEISRLAHAWSGGGWTESDRRGAGWACVAMKVVDEAEPFADLPRSPTRAPSPA